ncbi:MAG: M56 family metallopeptidase [Telluria sp.]
MSASMPDLMSTIGWTLVHFLWQGALVGCATAVVLALLRNARPQSRYLAACFGLLGCVAWPAADLCLQLANAGTAAGMLDSSARIVMTGAAQAAPGVLAWLQGHMQWLVGAWASCALALALRMVAGLFWLGRTGQSSAVDARWQARLDLLAERAGITRAVRLRIVDRLASPITAGWWRPVVLVPAALVSGMPADLLEALLAHEIAHVRRHDYLVNLLQNVVETLLFYHPAVWWISGRIRAEREQVADDFAACQLGDARRLAHALSELEKLQFSAHRLALAANGGELFVRIKRLVRPGTQALGWTAMIPFLGLAALCAAAYANTAPAVTLVPAARHAPAVADFTRCAKPLWPKADLQAEHTGTVTLGFLVDTDGTVADAKLIGSSGHPGLDMSAQAGIAKCRFHPATRNGQPVREWMQMQYVWTLE